MAQKQEVIKYTPEGFSPYGKMRDFFQSHAMVRMAGGTYDAGKTFSCMAYMDMLARAYKGARLTFVHRTLKRVHQNIVPSFYKYLGYTPTSRDDPNPTSVTRFGGEKPEFFEYSNGTRIYLNGLDDPNNLKSDFFDAAYVNQCELLPFDTWNEITARVSERAGTLPVAFLFGDCNPDVPHHWIRQQTKVGKIKYFKMSFLDNPEIVAQGAEELAQFKRAFENTPDPALLKKIQHLFTPSGARRVERLKNLEGLRYKHGFLGEWCSGEGLVFETFEPETHIMDNFTISARWPRYLSIDWGFRNPASCLWWAISPDDVLYCYKEIYKSKLTKPDFIRLIKENCESVDRIRHVAVDSADQDGIEQLRRAGFRVNEPKKDRIAQIDTIKERLKVLENGEPGILFLRDRLVHAPDPEMKEKYRPVEVTDEFLSCTYDEKLKGTHKDDEAVIGDNHGIDSMSYLLMSLKVRRSVGSGRVIHSSVKIR